MNSHAAPRAASDEQQARIAARRDFVDMKRCFMEAASAMGGPLGARLQRKVRESVCAEELWPMRALVLGALALGHERGLGLRADLRRHLDSVFPDTGPETGFVPL
jgi:hypothetical protein